jgi:hypothetical protein
MTALKRSKLQRKFLNQMRSMADVPWPARKYKYPPTFANAIGAAPSTHIGTCKRPVGSIKMRRGRFGKLRPKQDVEVRCGGRVYLRRGSLGKRRVVCVDCLERKRAKARQLRVERQLQSRFGIGREHAAEERTSRIRRFMRKGSR